MNATCSVPDCCLPRSAKGFCNKHYLRWYVHGDPSVVKLIRGDDQARFWAKVDQSGGPDACWPFTGARDKDGYGTVWFRRKQQRAPRVSWVLTNDTAIPEGQVVRHDCDNPPCVNPCHLRLGSLRENSDDMVERDRAAKGEANRGGGKLTEGSVRAIRSGLAAGLSHRELGLRFGVARATVSAIARGRIWRSVQ